MIFASFTSPYRNPSLFIKLVTGCFLFIEYSHDELLSVKSDLLYVFNQWEGIYSMVKRYKNCSKLNFDGQIAVSQGYYLGQYDTGWEYTTIAIVVLLLRYKYSLLMM